MKEMINSVMAGRMAEATAAVTSELYSKVGMVLSETKISVAQSLFNEEFKDEEHRELFKKYKAADKHLQHAQSTKMSGPELLAAIEGRASAHKAYSFYKPNAMRDAS